MQWNKYIYSQKFVVCDLEYIDNLTDKYLLDFIKGSTHHFINSESNIKQVLDKYKNFSIILFNVSKDKQWIQNNYKNVFDCGTDLNVFSVEMSLIPYREYILAHQLFQEVSELLNKSDVHYYACGGTKIGILRNKTLLPWDWDIDLTIMETKENILTSEFQVGLAEHGITIIDGKPLKKDFKLYYKNTKLNFYMDMICMGKKDLDITEKHLCGTYYVNINTSSSLIWNDWQEYIESAYFYCCLVYNYMGGEKYAKEGVKLYEDLTHANRFKIRDYKDYLDSVFYRYKLN